MISARTGLQQPMTLQRLALGLRHCHGPRTGRKASCSQFPGEKLPPFGVWGLAEQLLVDDCADRPTFDRDAGTRSEEHTSELQSQSNLVCRLLLEKKKKHKIRYILVIKKKK